MDFSALITVNVAVTFRIAAGDARAVCKLKRLTVFVPRAKDFRQFLADKPDVVGFQLCQRPPEDVNL